MCPCWSASPVRHCSCHSLNNGVIEDSTILSKLPDGVRPHEFLRGNSVNLIMNSQDASVGEDVGKPLCA